MACCSLRLICVKRKQWKCKKFVIALNTKKFKLNITMEKLFYILTWFFCKNNNKVKIIIVRSKIKYEKLKIKKLNKVKIKKIINY